MKEKLKERLAVLTDLIGVSGNEQAVIRYCMDQMRPLADEVRILPCGDLIAAFRGSEPGPSMMLAAHADEIGIHIRSISRDGFIYFGTYGGVQLKTMLASRVLLNGSKGIVKGVVGVTPAHVTPRDQWDKVPPMDSCYIDVGASSDAEVREMGLDVGTTDVVDRPLTELNRPDLVTGRCIDDRAGCSVILELAENIASGAISFKGTVYLTITVQEEVGLTGAIHATEAVKPDCFIAVDTAPCGGTPDVPERLLPTKLGCGPIITIGDTANSLTMIFPNHGMLSFAKRYAEENGIPLQRVPSPGAGATDAGGVNYVGSHCPALAVQIPRRYSHTASEVLDLNDMVYAYRLLEGFIRSNGDISFDFFEV